MDEKEIIYLALSNQIMLYELQKGEIEEPEELEMVEYIIQRSLEILDSYKEKIITEENTPIPPPVW